jgi:hypothetical protein
MELAAVVLDSCTSSWDSVATELLRVLQPRRRLLLNENMFHVRSCAHILNLTVDESLEQTLDVTNRVHKMIQNVKFSHERLQSFLVQQKSLFLIRLSSHTHTFCMILSQSAFAPCRTGITNSLNNTMDKFPMETPTVYLYFNNMCEIHVLFNTWRNIVHLLLLHKWLAECWRSSKDTGILLGQ